MFDDEWIISQISVNQITIPLLRSHRALIEFRGARRVIPILVQRDDPTTLTKDGNRVNDTTLDDLKKNQGNLRVIECKICYKMCNNEQLVHIADCSHLFCFDCATKYINAAITEGLKLGCCIEDCSAQLIIKANEKKMSSNRYFVDCVPNTERKRIKKYIKHYQQLRKKCQNCMRDQHGTIIQTCNQCKQPSSIILPKNMKKCPKCRKIIEKSKGCDHIKCVCQNEFCFACQKDWNRNHICEFKIPQRTGLAYALCFVVKVCIAIPSTVIMVTLVLILSTFICLLSSLFMGPFAFFQFLQILGKTQKINQFFKCLIFVISFLCFPLFVAVFILPGFLLPIVNLVYDKKVFFAPNTLSDLIIDLMGCLLTIQLL